MDYRIRIGDQVLLLDLDVDYKGERTNIIKWEYYLSSDYDRIIFDPENDTDVRDIPLPDGGAILVRKLKYRHTEQYVVSIRLNNQRMEDKDGFTCSTDWMVIPVAIYVNEQIMGDFSFWTYVQVEEIQSKINAYRW